LEELEIKLQNLKVKPKCVNVRTLSDISITFSVNQDIPNGSSIIFRFKTYRNLGKICSILFIFFTLVSKLHKYIEQSLIII